MSIAAAIRDRRSIKRFTDRPVSRTEIEQILDSAVHAPNHRLTNPWRFYVLGPEARAAYGLVLGNRKANKIPDPAAAQAMRDNVSNEHRALPGMIAVAMVKSENAEQQEEDYAATMMAVQNIALAAHEIGLGTALRTGAIMNDPAARAAAGVGENERIIAIVNVGAPADVPPAKGRMAATDVTTWMP